MSWAELRMVADQFADAQVARMACDSRLRNAGMDGDLYEPQRQAVAAAEDAWKKVLVKVYRRVVPAPLRDWQKASQGIGEHTFALLLGATGHPLHAEPYAWMIEAPEGHVCDPLRCKKNAPADQAGFDTQVGHVGGRHLVALEPFDRTLSQWRAYCGWGDVKRKRRKGMTADDAMAMGNPRAKQAGFLLAEGAVKQKCQTCRDHTTPGLTWQVSKGCTECGVYRQVYVERRMETMHRDDWTDGHRSNDALRITAKQILKDIWTVAKENNE